MWDQCLLARYFGIILRSKERDEILILNVKQMSQLQKFIGTKRNCLICWYQDQQLKQKYLLLYSQRFIDTLGTSTLVNTQGQGVSFNTRPHGCPIKSCKETKQLWDEGEVPAWIYNCLIVSLSLALHLTPLTFSAR